MITVDSFGSYSELQIHWRIFISGLMMNMILQMGIVIYLICWVTLPPSLSLLSVSILPHLCSLNYLWNIDGSDMMMDSLGPDMITGKFLQVCTNELWDIFNDTFHSSLDPNPQHKVSKLWNLLLYLWLRTNPQQSSLTLSLWLSLHQWWRLLSTQSKNPGWWHQVLAWPGRTIHSSENLF